MAYIQAGGAYKPSKAEQNAADFDDVIPNIAKISFSIGGFFSGFEGRTITQDDKHYMFLINGLTPYISCRAITAFVLFTMHPPQIPICHSAHLPDKEEFIEPHKMRQ